MTLQLLPPPWRALLRTSPTLTHIMLPPPLRQPPAHPCLLLTIQPRHSTFILDPERLPTSMPADPYPKRGTSKSITSFPSSLMFTFTWTKWNGTPSRLTATSPSPQEANTNHNILTKYQSISSVNIMDACSDHTNDCDIQNSKDFSPSPSPELFVIPSSSNHKIYLPTKT